MSYLVDSHCHLDFDDFSEEGVAAVVARAQEAGIGHMVTICCRVAEFENRILPIAEAHDAVDCSVGTHPHQAGETPERTVTTAQLVSYAKHPKVVGIGESGLDYYYDTAPREEQAESFRIHIRAALESDLPLIIHARDADDDIARILREETAGAPLRAVLHCFSSGRGLAEAGLDMGLYVSMSGIVTFKNAEDLRGILRDVPLDRLLVETDSPYLAPVPKRGKRNEPAFVAHTAAFVADVKSVTADVLTTTTTDNFYTLFSKAKRKSWPKN